MKLSIHRFLLITIVLFFGELQAQTLLSGTVIDEQYNEPLIGANVIVEGTSEGTATDFDGNFEFQTSKSLPLRLNISYTGYSAKIVEITSNEKITVRLSENAITTEVVEVKGQRISEKQKAAPLTIESLDVLAIKETTADNFYDGLGNLKGVDLTAASLGFKVINTRGFNSTSPVRSLQIIDGVDNQAPGLNFSLGNFLGSSELDVLKVDLVVGASSAFYGPNAFNGVISMTTKNPFFQKGLSASLKFGERNLANGAVRWGDAIKNKDGLDFFAYKFNFSYLTADDWVADNRSAVDGTDTPADNIAGYDAVNVYGDEYFAGNDFTEFPEGTYPGLSVFHRTGYSEIDLVDYDTKNMKANAAFHFRLNPELAEQSPEFIVSSSFGSGTTVYQGDNRFSLKNILFFQNRLELQKRDKYFIRAYATHEDAGDSYDPYFTALELQRASKDERKWSQDYFDFWLQNPNRWINQTDRYGDDTYPRPSITFDPVTFEVTRNFDQKASNDWLARYQDSIALYHNLARNFADSQTSLSNTEDFYEPGTQRFEEKFNEITSTPRSEGGTQFYDKSALYHVNGEYKFEPTWTDFIKAGASFRYYTPVSEGSVFYDTAGIKLTNYEFGFYGGIEKSFSDDKWKVQATLRADKNQNFRWLLSPAGSIVWNPTDNNYLRLSFSSAIRNPTLTDQFLYLDVGRAILAGNLNGVDSLVTVESLQDYLNGQGDLEYFNIDGVQPEQVNSFELGYRTSLFNNTYVDASYYYSIYNNFLGYNIGVEARFDDQIGFPTYIQAYRYAANSINTVTTQGFSIGVNYYFARFYSINGNYSWNRLNSNIDDPIIPAFNTPEHKFNIGISGRNISANIGGLNINNLGFNINYKWVEGFLFEGSPQFTGFIPTYDLLDAQVNYNFKRINTTVKVGATNLLNNLTYQTYGGPLIGRLAYISIVYDWNKRD